ncbi:MAG TPA: PA14 domain-containing protein, partial [Chthoniobacteraceae bacterium]|nr:PA14 domain-containing protein [Chthoniobacteraceae bacterium]
MGEPVQLTLSGPAATYQVRDYYGNLIDQGPVTGSVINVHAIFPGWYKVYVCGTQDQGAPYGKILAGTTFCIFRNNSNFPEVPSASQYPPAQYLQDEVMRDITAMGPQRYQIQDASNPDGDIATIQALITIDNLFYLGMDSVRPRPLMIAFPNGTSDLAGVQKVVQTFQGQVEYWEGRNEPNSTTDGASFVTNELIPFYQTVKGVNPNLKVLAPAIVTIGPYGLGWLQAFFGAGGAKYMDALSFHAYNNVNGDPWLVQQSFNGLNTLLAQYGLQNMEVWQTEQGYMAACYGAYEPRLQGRWTMVQMMAFEQYGVPKEHNYLWYDRNISYWAFPMFWENFDGSLNPAAPLMRVWSEELFGATFKQAFDFGQPGNHMYLGSLFSGPAKSVAAFQSWGSTDGQVTLAVSSGSSVNYVSPFGLQYPMPVVNGQVTIPVPELPVYVELAPGQTVSVVQNNWGPDLALENGVTATPSGTWTTTGGANDISKTFNGVLEDWYYYQNEASQPWTDNIPNGFPYSYGLNLPSVQTVDHVVVYAGVPWQTTSTLVDYDLQYDATGQGDWITLQHVSEPLNSFPVYSPEVDCTADSFFSDRNIFQHSFPPVQTQHIRLLINNVTFGGGANQAIVNAGGQTGPQTVAIREVEAYNASAQSGAAGLSAGSLPPLIAAVQIPDNTVYSGPADITIPAGVISTVAAPIVSVQYFANGTLIGEDTASVQHSFTWIDAPAGQYAITVQVTDANGNVTTSAPVNVTVAVPASISGSFVSTGRGLTGEYFQNPDLTGYPLFSRLDENINFSWGANSPDPSVAPNTFSAQWSGEVEPLYSQTYTFTTQSDAAVRLWVNGQELINDWTPHSLSTDSGNIPLRAGSRYSIVVEYSKQDPSATLQLSWSSASQPLQVIPPTQFYPAITITSPASGVQVSASSNLILATDTIGMSNPIKSVEFYGGDLLLGGTTAAPYQLDWIDLPAGNFPLFAVATDAFGNIATSPVNQLTVAPLASGSVAAAATFIRGDLSTAGNWQGVYGGDGYNVVGDDCNYPSYAVVTQSGEGYHPWAESTPDVRGLQKSSVANDRIASCWYSQTSGTGASITVDVNLTDGQPHSMALYAVDWDGFGPRSEAVSILDAGSGQVLASGTLSSFENGQYLVWNVTGHVRLQVTNLLANSDAVISGLFFGPPASGPAAPAGTASFVMADGTTQGNWQGEYGSSGYNVINST